MKVTTDKPRVCAGGFVFRKGRVREVGALTSAMADAGVYEVTEDQGGKVPADETVDIGPDEPNSDGLDQMSQSELQEQCVSRGLPTYGSKATLRERIREHDAS